jgi:hypothetical protein
VSCRIGVTPLYKVLHFGMPTSHRRHAITETDDIAGALEMAAKTWPNLADKPGALLRRLILLGRNTLVNDRVTAEDAREQAIDAPGRRRAVSNWNRMVRRADLVAARFVYVVACSSSANHGIRHFRTSPRRGRDARASEPPCLPVAG